MALGCSSEDEQATGMWPSHVEKTLESLTFPQDDWSPADFGQWPELDEAALLNRYRPKVFIHESGLGPIDFYRDALPRAELVGRHGEVQRKGLGREDLLNFSRSYGYYLRYPSRIPRCYGRACNVKTVPIYGRAWDEQWSVPTGGNAEASAAEALPMQVKILRYNLVFPSSGLPQKLPWWSTLIAFIAGSPSDWHDLDIHGGIYVVLAKQDDDYRALMVLLSRHNQFSVHVVGKDLEMQSGEDLRICYAERSNEPYLCPNKAETQLFPVSANPTQLRYVYTGEDGAWDSGYDVVQAPEAGAVPLKTRLEMLSSRDPLTVSWINLGEKKTSFGVLDNPHRYGPLGMDLNRSPAMPTMQQVAEFFYFEAEDKRAFDLLEEHFTSFFATEEDIRPIIEHNGKRLHQSLQARLTASFNGAALP